MTQKILIRIISILPVLLMFQASFAHAEWLPTPQLSTSAPSVPAGSMATSVGETSAAKAKKSDLTLTWNSALKAGQFQDQTANKGTYSSLGVSLNLKSTLTPFLDMKIIPRAYFRSGHVQSSSAVTGRMQSFDLLEASANLHQKEFLEFSIGALNGAGYFSSALVDEDLAFPAVRAGAQWGERCGDFAGVFAEAAVPTSATLTSNSGEDERTPTFMVGGMRGQYLNSEWQLKSHLVSFQFQDLTKGIATDSALLGNTASTANQSPTSEFLYEYRGYEGGLSARWNINRRWGVEVEGTALQNQIVPGTQGQGTVAQAKIDFWNGSLKWTPSAEYFRLGPDATVAIYNLPDYQTNRVGYDVGLALQYRRQFRVKLKGGEREAVFESATQSREKFYSLTLETLDAVL